MKQCAHCARRYADDTLNFCLDDGTPLSAASGPGTSPPPTIPFASPPQAGESQKDSGRAKMFNEHVSYKGRVYNKGQIAKDHDWTIAEARLHADSEFAKVFKSAEFMTLKKYFIANEREEYKEMIINVYDRYQVDKSVLEVFREALNLESPRQTRNLLKAKGLL